MTAIPLRPGDAAYLIPRNPGAPRAAWSRPACVVVRVDPTEITVRLVDGTEVSTHRDNVTRTLPTEPRRPRPHTPAASAVLPEGAEQAPLF